jgi:hypothetical protein
MSRIVLHVGTHKTATTTVQDTLALNRRHLRGHGVVFPQVGPSAGQHALVTRWIPLPERYCDSRPALESWQALVRGHAAGDATVFVSSEEFSRSRPGVDMRELAGLVAPFGRRTVVCVLRSQLAYLQSIYLQVTKEARVAGFEAFLAEALRTNLATGLQLDYGALFDRLLEGFAPEEIVFVCYETAVSGPGGIIGGIFERLGLGEVAAGLAPLAAGDSNVSPVPLAAWAANQISAPGVAGRGLIELASEVIAEIFGAAARTTLFTRAEAARVAAHFEPLNAAFEARYRRIDPGFALAPLSLPEGLVYRGQLTVPFWIRLGQRLYRLPAG